MDEIFDPIGNVTCMEDSSPCGKKATGLISWPTTIYTEHDYGNWYLCQEHFQFAIETLETVSVLVDGPPTSAPYDYEAE